MKKTFILAFFMAFCSMVFGQNWGNVNMAFPENMTVTSKVFIDGTELNGTNYVLGAFCGDELRGSAKLQYFAPEDDYLAMVLVYGNGVTGEHPADQIKFKLYDLNTDKVYSISNDEALPLVNDKMNGSLTPYAPYEINFLGNPAARIGETYYATLQEAVGKAENGETVTLLTSISLAKTIKIEKNITLDLNGKTIAGTDNATASFALIEVQPDKELTVEGNNGTITLTATNNRQFNAFSSVISNQRGKLVVNNATIQHLGGTDMAYAIDNLTNTGAQIAETVINGGTIKSTYRAIRQFLNSSAQGVNNILTVNGGTIEGVNKSIWMQDANAKANPGKLTVSENASLKGDVYLTVTAGSTEWPVEVMVKAAALKEGAEVLANNNVPAKYEVKLVDDYYTVVEIDPVAEINGTIYYTLQSAFAAATEGQTVVMLRDVTEDFAINNTAAVTFDMAGKTLTGAIMPSTANLTVKNGTIVNNNTSYSAIEIKSGSIVLNEDVKVSSVRHAIRIDGAVAATIKGGEYTLIPKSGRTHHALNVSGSANVTIEGGKFVGPKGTASDSGSAVNVQSGAKVTISGGEFSGGKRNTLASSGTLSLTGGRYDQDVQKYCAPGYMSLKGADGWYTVVEAAARIGEKYYATFGEAYKAAKAGDVVELFRTVVITDEDGRWINYSTKQITVKAEFGDVAFRVQTSYQTMVQFGSMTIESDDYCIIVGASNSELRPTVDIIGGTYNGATTAISVTKGSVIIAGGTFKVEPYEGSYEYTINCIDANYKNGTAEVSIKGGKFYNFNPMNNAAEGPGTNFLTAGYAANEDAEGYWNVIKAVAKNDNNQYFSTLQAAIDACAAGNNTITLLADNNENVTVVQAPNTKVTINGANKNYKGTITVDGKSSAYATAALTIKNVNFDATSITKDASINLGVKGNNNTRYTNNVTVENCSFVGVNKAMAGIKNYTGGCKNLVVSGCTAEGLHSLVQVKGVEGITVAGVTIKNGKNGIAVGTSTNVNIKGSTIEVEGYGVRADGTGAYNMTLAENTINANLPIVVREVEGAYNLTVESGSYTASNEKGAAVVFTTGDDGTFEAPTSDATATIKVDVATFGFEARIGNVYYTKFDNALEAAEEDNNTITVLNPVVITENKTYELEDINVEGDVYPMFRIQNGATVTFDGGNFTNGDYIFTLGEGATDEATSGNLVINGGTYVGETTVANVVKGLLTINGGEFSLSAAYQDNYNFLINCYDASYKNDLANVEIKGGTFHKFNPENNAAEGAGTTFCAEGYAVVYNAMENSYTVVKAVAQIGEKYYATLPAAVEAAQENEIVTLLDNATGAGVVIDKDVTIDFADFTYSLNEPVGSSNTVSNGLQILAGNNVTLMNGTLKVADDAANKFYILVQNYANLTVEGMILEGENLDKYSFTDGDSYVLSNNSGNVNIINTTIKANLDGNLAFAFDVCDSESYTVKPVVYVKGNDTRVEGRIEVSATIEENLHIQGGTYDFDVEEAGYCDNAYFTKDNGNDTWTVEGPYVAQIGETRYATLAAAITAATAGQTIEFIADITEDVTIQKDLTIDGAGKKYTGNISVKGSTVDVLVKNVNFINGTGYAITTNTTKSIKVENCTVNNYGYGFLYANKSTPTVVVKNVEVNNANYGMHYVYGSNATLENVTMSDVKYGLYIQNYAAKTITVKNSDITSIEIWERDGYSATQTFKFEGGNKAGALDDSQYAKYILTATDATLTAPEGHNVTTTEEGYTVKRVDGVYKLVANMVVNTNTNVAYPSLAEAISAATAGNTIQFLADLTEDVTIQKDLTIDGAGKKYTGNISVKGSTVDVIVENVNFVDYEGYAITTNTIKSITVEDCTVKNYGFGFLYSNKSTPTVVVKNVTVENCNYGMHWVYGSKATLENVTMTNVVNGLYIQNYASKTITVKNSNISSIAIWERTGSSGVQTFKFEGANTVGTLSASQYAKYILTATDATLTAPEGHVVTTTVEGCVVVRNEGVYLVKKAVAQIGDNYYASIQEAIDAAESGDEIVLLVNINLDETALGLLDNQYNTYFKVEDKAVTIDLNGMEIKGTFNATPMLVGMFSTENNGHLTLVDNSEEGTALVDLKSGYDQVYALIVNYEPGCSITIDGGTYKLDKAKDAIVYTGASLNEGGVKIEDGIFELGNVGTGTNGQPWIFNVKGQNNRGVQVNGGTFNADINHQYWANEVYVPETLALQKIDNDTWTVVEAVAYAEEKAKSTGATVRKVGYATLAEAVNFVDKNHTVTVIKAHETMAPAVAEKDMTIDFAGYAITGDIYPVVRIQNKANVTVKNGNITNGDYIFTLGSSDQTTAGNLTIESGKYVGETTVASVTKGNLVIKGGEFSIVEFENSDYAYVINCYDASYNAEPRLANVYISGGKFYNFNPENNAAEGANTNFCAEGYGAVETTTGSNIWTVVPKQGQMLTEGWNWFSSYININGAEGLATLENALGQNGVMIKRNGGYVEFYNSDNDAYDMWIGTNFDAVSVKEMYMINTNADTHIQLRGDIVDYANTEITINQGWNWIGYPVSEAVNINAALKQVQAKMGDKIVGRNATMEYIEGAGWYAGNLNSLEPGQGYMYYRASGESFEFTYNVPATREEVKANITADNNYWVPNSAEFANIMTMTAVLNIDGNEMKEDFEVAAFANGEVRGSARPIYIEAIDRYMVFMNIYGEGNEELTFKCYDIYSDEEYTLSNNLVYSDFAMIGSASEPYMLTLNTMGIGENAANTISLYPNPTTINTAISFETTCDMVEVFNALGVKVAEYRNVETIDGIEEAGVYVIRVTNDSTVQNCRLIVK